MDRKRISEPAARRERNRDRGEVPTFLELRAVDGFWYGYGTVTTPRGSCRLRRSTRLPATPEHREAALDAIWETEQTALDELITGVAAVAVKAALAEYLELNRDGTPVAGGRGDQLGGADRRVLGEVLDAFETRILKTIDQTEWQSFLNKRHADNSLDTKRRFASPIRTFLDWCLAPERRYLSRQIILTIKEAGQRRQPPSRKRRERARVAEMTPDLLATVFDQAHITLRAQLYVEWTTGARVSSVLFGCRLRDLVLGEKGSVLTFRDTKNGDDVAADLHPATVAVLLEYLEWRGGLHGRESPIFLTYQRRPYSPRGREFGWSGQNKTAFNAMKRRAIRIIRDEAATSARALRRSGDRRGTWRTITEARAKAALVGKLTQHWLRHWFATYALAMGMPRASVMQQGGWRDKRSMENYEHDVPKLREAMVNLLPIGRDVADSSEVLEQARAK